MAWSRVSRHKRGYGWDWEQIRAFILERDCHLCQPCLRKGMLCRANEVDHIIPKAKGGTNDADNLQAIGPQCHKDKTALDNGGKVKISYGPDGWPAR